MMVHVHATRALQHQPHSTSGFLRRARARQTHTHYNNIVYDTVVYVGKVLVIILYAGSTVWFENSGNHLEGLYPLLVLPGNAWGERNYIYIIYIHDQYILMYLYISMVFNTISRTSQSGGAVIYVIYIILIYA